jgi:mannobiose 2-epimerase
MFTHKPPAAESLSSKSPSFFLKKVLEQYRTDLEDELREILRYWMENTVDQTAGGFIGRITHDNQKHFDAPKGSVLNSRILWTFSAAYNLTKNVQYLQAAQRAYAYLLKYFIDKEYGGVYWTVQANGEPLDDKKQIYALAFAVYGLSEYYKASEEEYAKEAAIQLYKNIVAHSYDKIHGGYIEALNREWKAAVDLRLSAKDANERKSMNTHLHLLEGFSNLYRIWPDEGLKQKLQELLHLFLTHILAKDTNHLNLFFEDDWTSKSDVVSYGHDVEAAWLLQEAAESIGGEDLLSRVITCSLKVAEAAGTGLDEDGGLWYEYDKVQHNVIKQKHWWPQSEAIVGFFNAWQNTGEENWLNRSLKSWSFVQNFIKDKKGGEWHWGVNEDYSVMDNEDKAGLWKCPYHNSRACIEIIHRINALLD